MGYVGLAFAILLFIVFGILLIRTVQLSGKNTLDEVIILKECKVPRVILGGLTVFIMFGILVVMSAGAGALVNQVFSIPPFIGSILFCIFVSIAAMGGLSGTVKVFSVLVPILVATTIVICILALNKYGLNFDIPVINKNPMLGNWCFSAITYVSYNMITLIGTMIPVGAFVKKRSTVYGGIISGCMFAMAIALGILMGVTSIYGAPDAELPMLEIAFRLNTFFGFLYAVLLLCAMYGTSLASIVAIIVYFEEKSKCIKKNKNVTIWLLGLLAFLGSLFGFGNLVDTVYPIFGYIGFLILLLIASNFAYLKLKKFKDRC